jgi:hypothetical protein
MELLEQIEEYLVQTRTSPSTFGRLAIGDPRLVGDLRSGRRVRLKTMQKIQGFLGSSTVKIGLLHNDNQALVVGGGCKPDHSRDSPLDGLVDKRVPFDSAGIRVAEDYE